MLIVNKNELIKILEEKAKRKNVTQAKGMKLLIKFLKKSNLTDFYTDKTYNIGLIVEKIVLNYLGLSIEDNAHEVKSYVLNGWNTLTNPNVTTVYVAIIHTSDKVKNGLYKINAELIRGLEVSTLTTLTSIKKEYICSLTELFKA